MILAIDPGPEKSGFVAYHSGTVLSSGVLSNDNMLRLVQATTLAENRTLATEMIASYGMAVGATVFETCVWIGRFVQEWSVPDDVLRIYRRDVKLHLCGTARAKEGNVRAALIDKFGPGKEKAIGIKSRQGPLYGVKSHAWSALAVAIYAEEAA